MYRIESEETSVSGVKRILLERIDTNISLLSDETNDRDKAVHEARKNFKRIRAALRLVRGDIGDMVFKRENMRYRDASRLLAPLRDSAVLVETIDLIKKQYALGLSPDAFRKIREKLVSEHARHRYEMLEIDNQPAVVVDILREGRPFIEALPIDHDDFRAIEGGLEKVYQRCGKRMKLAYAHPEEPELFHDWRKRVKYLWYQMDILQLMWPTVLNTVAEELHQISKYLGDAHDLVVLKETIESRPDLFANEKERPLLFALLDQRQVELEMSAHPLGKRMFTEKPQDFVNRLATYYTIWQKQGINGVPPKQQIESKPTLPTDQLISTKDAAKSLGVPPRKVRKLIRAQQLSAFKIGNVWVIPVADVAKIRPKQK